MTTFPNSVMPVDNPTVSPAVGPFSTISGVYPAPGNNTNSPRSVRYAAFNVADNIATAIRQDTSIRPVLFVIGLNESTGEPLDADWLARVANDPGYKDTNGNSVCQAGQSSGMYFNVSASGWAEPSSRSPLRLSGSPNSRSSDLAKAHRLPACPASSAGTSGMPSPAGDLHFPGSIMSASKRASPIR